MDRHTWSPSGAAPTAACLAALLLAGCGYRPPDFRLNTEGPERAQATSVQSAEIARWLAALFGTPDAPKAPDAARLRREPLRRAAGPVRSDEQGMDFGLYRKHCAACHGISGDGAGPAAAVLDPYPRDYRRGVFKYTSTRSGAKPIRKDLQRTLYRGVPGTAMPSFAHLAPEESEALIDYVIYLAIRGETELYLLQLVVDEQSYLPPDMERVREEGVLSAVESWLLPERRAAELVVEPPPRPPVDRPEALAASIAKGRELYLARDSQCVKCHGPEGDGNGEEKELYDDWNKSKKGVTPEQTAALARLFKLPLQRLRPRDFRKGVFQGGSGPADLYLRICVGIKGTPMPAAGPAPGVPGPLKPDEIWHVVDYVRALAAGQQAPR